ncbi:CRISPR-associated Cas3 family helicase [Enterobacter sp. BIGb0383]|uniref:CRISPR-associated helicase Cas3' n=1 Tax=unclassified Enterobacter TaxID=2608935 RepID=UPI000FA3A628|nr:MULTISPECIES: CRISPR-associated helicase Cas3' [unclassified Enterobacter]ROP59520.1 CRISPR-associated Cas3 family helicase [Enterobacter sp. BIGb0383]ROS09012.1 CRISPR-associated Cas3 family helicase [Enterobacter sp. BIGb0359]
MDYLRYWGKSHGHDGEQCSEYHLLAYHCLDVAACGYIMMKQNRYGVADVFSELNMPDADAAQWLAWLFACHDIGKFSRGFQKLVDHKSDQLVPPVARVIYGSRHDTLGFWLWKKISARWVSGEGDLFPDINIDERKRFGRALDIWMEVSAGHHGVPPDKMDAGALISFVDDDIQAANNFLRDLHRFFSIDSLPAEWLVRDGQKSLKQWSWFFAGLITLADWLGSDERYFPFVSRQMPLSEYWTIACQNAEKALQSLPVSSPISSYQDYRHLFPFIETLTPLQRCATTLELSAPGPQLIVLEDVTGAGKTEAALILVHRLLSEGKGKGLFVGLPTMATANAMYQRLAGAWHVLFAEGSRPSLVLAHGGSRMSAAFRDSIWQPSENKENDYAKDDASTIAECHAWFADSRKKALLAEVGVGTLDQLLMAVMPFRHQSLRLLGIRDKILILDEVHAYDGYMVKLLEGLLRFHSAQGGSVIILSATLPASLREKLLSAFREGAGFSSLPSTQDAGYPWLSHLSSQSLMEQQLQTREDVKRRVSVIWITERARAIELIYQAVEQGQCICWIRNTVDDAMGVFRQLLNDGKIPEDDLLLFHSRFAFADRVAVEEKTLSWFSKASSGKERRGKVLIATQVVEQSLDLDFDWMISDLAPVDLLIQRAGRLQRHIRDADGNRKMDLPDGRHSPVLYILAPEWQEDANEGWLGDELKGTGYVYPDHACLWRTQALLREQGEIRMPDNARLLVDGVYEVLIAAPAALESIEINVYGKMLGQKAVAGQSLLQRNKGYDSESSDFLWDKTRELSTRLGEESVDVYLGWLDSAGELQPVAGGTEFPWEMSRLQVRVSWWKKQQEHFVLPDEVLLERFRKQYHRPVAQVLLVSEKGEADYYSKCFGLMCPQTKRL